MAGALTGIGCLPQGVPQGRALAWRQPGSDYADVIGRKDYDDHSDLSQDAFASSDTA